MKDLWKGCGLHDWLDEAFPAVPYGDIEGKERDGPCHGIQLVNWDSAMGNALNSAG